MHRLLTGCPVNLEVDHINGKPLDNRLENLRIVTKSGNQRNQKMKNKFGMRGICFVKKERHYRAHISDNEGKRRSKAFACKKHGEEKALELAKEWRLQMELDIGGYMLS